RFWIVDLPNTIGTQQSTIANSLYRVFVHDRLFARLKRDVSLLPIRPAPGLAPRRNPLLLAAIVGHANGLNLDPENLLDRAFYLRLGRLHMNLQGQHLPIITRAAHRL